MKARWVIHPVLIGLYPIVSLYAHNIHQTAPRELVTELIATAERYSPYVDIFGRAVALRGIRRVNGEGA